MCSFVFCAQAQRTILSLFVFVHYMRSLHMQKVKKSEYVSCARDVTIRKCIQNGQRTRQNKKYTHAQAQKNTQIAIHSLELLHSQSQQKKLMCLVCVRKISNKTWYQANSHKIYSKKYKRTISYYCI